MCCFGESARVWSPAQAAFQRFLVRREKQFPQQITVVHSSVSSGVSNLLGLTMRVELLDWLGPSRVL